jgi:hyperosmotically inducible periplasmic protein
MVRFVHSATAQPKGAAMKPYRLLRPFVLAGLLFACATVATARGDDEMGSGLDQSRSDQPVTDTWITTKVKTELATADSVKSMDIDVKTVDGAVTLAGVLSSDIAVQKAIAAAQGVKGVKSVDASALKAEAPTNRR